MASPPPPMNRSSWASFIIILVVFIELGSASSALNLITAYSSMAAPTCDKIECPAFHLVHRAKDFQIRLYNETVWMSTAPIQDISFVSATRTGFLKLFNYIQGKNEEKEEVPMTAPVLTGILPSDGPFCASTFSVRFYVPNAFQKKTPVPASNLELHVDLWGALCFAVRKFGGFATDSNIAEEAAELEASLYDSPYANFFSGSPAQAQDLYIVAQYNSPFEFSGRVNEIWLPVHTKDSDCLALSGTS